MLKKRLHEIIRFCIVGIISFLVDYGLLFLCTEWFHIFYWYSSAIAFTVSVILNYWLCIIFVFCQSGKRDTRQITLFVGASAGGLGINQTCMWIFVELIGMHYMSAKILATIIVTFWNYVTKRKALQSS